MLALILSFKIDVKITRWGRLLNFVLLWMSETCIQF